MSIDDRSGTHVGPSSEEVLFFTYADAKYEKFVVPYVYFALRNNAAAKVEVVLEDEEGFRSRHRAAIGALEKLFPGRSLLRQSKVIRALPGIVPNTVRFVELPEWNAAYVYIGDIDILVFEDIMAMHLKLMAENALPFSNILRKDSLATGKPKLSGLHFSPFGLQYPLPDLDDLDLSVENDEHVLYQIMKRKGRLVPEEFLIRPECGIHVSLSRDPLGRTTGPVSQIYSTRGAHPWGGRHYFGKFMEQTRESDFLALLPYLDLEMRGLLLAVEGTITKQMRMLHRFACSYLIDKRLLVVPERLTIQEFFQRSNGGIDAEECERIFARTGLLAWPESPHVWSVQARSWLEAGNVMLGVEALIHVSEMKGGMEHLRRIGLVADYRERISEAGNEGRLLVEAVERTST